MGTKSLAFERVYGVLDGRVPEADRLPLSAT
jgi:hypothetical protein